MKIDQIYHFQYLTAENCKQRPTGGSLLMLSTFTRLAVKQNKIYAYIHTKTFFLGGNTNEGSYNDIFSIFISESSSNVHLEESLSGVRRSQESLGY